MKKFYSFRVIEGVPKLLAFLVVFMTVTGLRAQVTFTQTLNADFNKGVINNAIVSGDNVSLQFAATDVGTWLTTTVLPQTLTGHRAVSWNNRYAYIIGGYNNLAYVNTVYVGTIQAGGIPSWTALNPLPVALRDPAVCIGTNTIYVMGGRDASQVYNTIYYAAINADGTLGAWQTSAVTLPLNLWGHTATYLKGFIYVFGGTSSLSETTATTTAYYTKVKALNTLSSFTAGTALTAARSRHATVTSNGKLFVIGGYDNTGTKANTVYMATPGLTGAPGAWSSGTNLPVALSNHSAAVSNGMLVVMAGAVGATLSNTVYYAPAGGSPLVWTASPNVLYDFTKDGDVFTGNGQVYYTGGMNLSSSAILNCRYANMNLSANYVGSGLFVSNPFYELGAERLINSLSFTKVYTAPANLQVSYRLAGADGVWGDWSALATASPITINQTKQYLQYHVVFTGSTVNNSTLNDVTITTPGTELSGNLNATTTFTKALSPYWVTSDISFTAGSHTFQAGATLYFLPETGMSVGQASIICSGTAVDSVKFLYFTEGSGNWKGLYFNDDSDNGVSSQFNYTVIGNAGFGSNNANLYCLNTNEPLLNRCNIRSADGNGIRLNNSHISIQNTTIRTNTENGLYLESSNPTLITSTMYYNAGAGVHLTSNASSPNYSSSGTTIANNTCAIRYSSPNFTIYQPAGTPTLSGNTYNGICLMPGSISGINKVWNTITYDYILLGTVSVAEYAGATRLTIEPGNTIRTLAGFQLTIGGGYPYGGELYALGTADSLITFTSHNGLPGGWNGLYFTEYSDGWGGQSQLDYCVIENGNDYNYFSYKTTQPNLINHTKIQNALLDGARYDDANGSITNCQFLNNGRYPLYFMNTLANPVHTGNTYTGNVINRIAHAGGTYSFDRTLNYDGGVAYYFLNDVYIAEYAGNPRLTIEAGVVIDFASGTKLSVGAGYPYGGELWAIGTSPSPIVFRPYTQVAGDWQGIHFTQYNDDWLGVSRMEYCRVRLGSAQNLLIEGSNQPTIVNCNIKESAGNGIVLYQSSPSITGTTFSVNTGYPLKINDWTCNPYIKNNIYTSNTNNYIAYSGGTISSSRTLRFDNVPYHILGDIIVAEYAGAPSLTLQPGVTLLFNPGLKFQVGSSYPYGGQVVADGKSDSLISFKPFNNTAGGWAGINFTEYNDGWGGVSSMKYCLVEKGALYNLFADGSNQPTLDHCTFTGSTGDGLKLTGTSNITVKNCNFTYNAGNGIYFDNTATATLGNTTLLTCNIYNNTGYDLYNNSTTDINARYNYWGTGDSTMISFRIFDKSELSSKGRVYYGPFAQVPLLFTTNTILGGTLKYANTGANPMKNAAMTVKDFSSTTIASTTSNASGVYAFPSFLSGNYTMAITPSNAWGGVNSTDALAILNHFAQIIPLTGMKMAAADVNASHTINGTDALFVMKRYSSMISSFPAGDYLWHSDTVIVSGSNVTNNIDMLCFGDVNASYGPTKSSASVGLVHEGSLLVSSFQEFDMPVKLKTGMQVGAISLGFYYPEEYLEVLGAQLVNGVTGFSWTAGNGLFKMAWCDMNALNISDDGIVVILRMKAKDLSAMTTGIALELFEDCEFADALANPNPGAVVSVPLINTTITGISHSGSTSMLSVYPNPLTSLSVVSFRLSEEQEVHLALLGLTGNTVKEIFSGTLSAGDHRLPINMTGLNPGIYFLKITNAGSDKPFSEIIKLVVAN